MTAKSQFWSTINRQSTPCEELQTRMCGMLAYALHRNGENRSGEVWDVLMMQLGFTGLTLAADAIEPFRRPDTGRNGSWIRQGELGDG